MGRHDISCLFEQPHNTRGVCTLSAYLHSTFFLESLTETSTNVATFSAFETGTVDIFEQLTQWIFAGKCCYYQTACIK